MSTPAGARRSSSCRSSQGYGVDLGLLIDMADRFGLDAMAQVDLGTRMHRNRPLDELAPQATAVLQTALRRAAPGLIAEPPRCCGPTADPSRST